MRLALPVIKLGNTQEENLSKVLQTIEKSKDSDIILFAETTISGFLPNDNVSEMLLLGQEIPGDITNRISSACRENNVWVSIGLLEREDGKLFDTAVVITPMGEISMKYRRLSPGWHWPNSDPNVFCEGTEVQKTNTPFGSVATLICGDFFDEQNQIQKVKHLKPDYLHLLLVRSDEQGKEYSQDKWEKEEIPEYAERVKLLGIPVFMVNFIDGECFGGATIFSADGIVASALPVWQEGILRWEI